MSARGAFPEAVQSLSEEEGADFLPPGWIPGCTGGREISLGLHPIILHEELEAVSVFSEPHLTLPSATLSASKSKGFPGC